MYLKIISGVFYLNKNFFIANIAVLNTRATFNNRSTPILIAEGSEVPRFE